MPNLNPPLGASFWSPPFSFLSPPKTKPAAGAAAPSSFLPPPKIKPLPDAAVPLSFLSPPKTKPVPGAAAGGAENANPPPPVDAEPFVPPEGTDKLGVALPKVMEVFFEALEPKLAGNDVVAGAAVAGAGVAGFAAAGDSPSFFFWPFIPLALLHAWQTVAVSSLKTAQTSHFHLPLFILSNMPPHPSAGGGTTFPAESCPSLTLILFTADCSIVVSSLSKGFFFLLSRFGDGGLTYRVASYSDLAVKERAASVVTWDSFFQLNCKPFSSSFRMAGSKASRLGNPLREIGVSESKSLNEIGLGR